MRLTFNKIIASHYRYWLNRHTGDSKISYYYAFMNYTLILFILKCALLLGLFGTPIILLPPCLPVFLQLVSIVLEFVALYWVLKLCFPRKVIVEEEKELTKAEYYVGNLIFFIFLYSSLAILIYIAKRLKQGLW